MSQLALYLFGPPRLEMNGEAVHIPRHKALALLAYLATTGQSHSRDALATLLWPENDQSSARAELRRTLSVLKRALGSGWLNADRETICLNKGNNLSATMTFCLDVDEYQGKLKICKSHNHPPTVTCPECLTALEEAVALYKDDFMAGFNLKDCREYEERQFFQAEKLRSQLANALVRLCSFYESVKDFEIAIQYARRWLALDPLREEAHQQLMSLFWQSGQRSAALRQYEQCKQTLADELGVEPSEETKDLYQKIQANRLAAASRPKSNLPVQTTPFIGRETEIADIRAMLKGEDCRLLTLLGPGGSGKTWLAIEAVRELLDDFKHGIFFVNLAPLEDPRRIPTTIAAALSFSFSVEGTPEEQLLDYLGNKELLIIMDNFEHLLDGVSFVNQILGEAKSVKILATSRTSLNVSGEHIFDVWGLTYPESPVSAKMDIGQYSAIKLFENAAKRRQKRFELNDENIPDVIRISSLLEGMPLGIVLAASWVKMLNSKVIADEITRNLAFLDVKLKDLPQRQQGMRSVFNHSWRLLSEREQKILSALSIFRGGFTREAAETVADASLGDLIGLLEKSMLHQMEEQRFEVHELLRQYAADKLGCDPKYKEYIHSKHSNFYCQALGIWERDLQGAQQVEALQEMRLEIDNIRTAWVWAVEKNRVKSLFSAINGLCLFCYRNYQRLEGSEMIKSILKGVEAVEIITESKLGIQEASSEQIDLLLLQARTLAWDGFLNWKSGKKEIACHLTQRCQSLLEIDKIVEQDTRFEEAIALLVLSANRVGLTQIETWHLAEEAVQLFKSIDELWWVGLALEELGTECMMHTFDEGVSILEESLNVRRTQNDIRGIANSLYWLSITTEIQGLAEKADQLLYEAIEMYSEIDDRSQILYAYAQLGSHWVHRGQFHQARSLEHDSLAAYHDLGYTQSKLAILPAVAGYPDLYLGEYQAARNQAHQALQLLADVTHPGVPVWTAFSIDILGRVALVEGAYLEVERRLQESILIYEAANRPGNVGQNLACLGFAAREVNQIIQAQNHFWNALKIGLGEVRVLALIHTLPGIALLFAESGDVERAVELYALASTRGMVANSKWFDDIAGNEISSAAEGLPNELAEAARARGLELDLRETAAELLVELKEKGWDNPDK